MKVHSLPTEITETKQQADKLMADVARRDAHTGEEFSMTVGKRVFSGKGAREEAAAALTRAAASVPADAKAPVCGSFRGFDILVRRAPLVGDDEERPPQLLIRGVGLYVAQINPENPLGTMQSIEYALRALDKGVMEAQDRAARCERLLADYQEQFGKPFEHEARLKELLARQAALNAALDLDKGEQQAAPPAGDDPPLGSDDPAEPVETPRGETPPRRRTRRRREYYPPDLDDQPVPAPGMTLGPRP